MTQKILIYGGSGGIGSATARMLHEKGARVHLVGRDEERLGDLSEEMDATYTVGDVTDPALFERVAEEAGESLAGLVYAVGTIHLKPVQRLSDEAVLNDFYIHALGALRAVRTALPALKNSDVASIVLYSSVAATRGFSAHASMGLAKGAINGLTVSLAAELAPRIRVNAIAPSLTQTNVAKPILSSEKIAASLAGMHPLKRLGNAEDIASLTAFLLSGQSAWMTGQIIGVDGGRGAVA